MRRTEKEIIIFYFSVYQTGNIGKYLPMSEEKQCTHYAATFFFFFFTIVRELSLLLCSITFHMMRSYRQINITLLYCT